MFTGPKIFMYNLYLRMFYLSLKRFHRCVSMLKTPRSDRPTAVSIDVYIYQCFIQLCQEMSISSSVPYLHFSYTVYLYISIVFLCV